MRRIVLAVTLLSTPAVAAPSPDAPPTKPAKPDATPGLRWIPKDATGGASQPGGGGKILMYEVARGQDVVVAEVRDLLKKAKLKILKEEKSPRGTVRLELIDTGKLYKVSVTGDATRSAIIVTMP